MPLQLQAEPEALIALDDATCSDGGSSVRHSAALRRLIRPSTGSRLALVRELLLGAAISEQPTAHPRCRGTLPCCALSAPKRRTRPRGDSVPHHADRAKGSCGPMRSVVCGKVAAPGRDDAGMRQPKRQYSAEAWEADYQRDGRVDIDLSRRRLRWVMVIGVVFAVVGLSLALAPSSSPTDQIVGWICGVMGVAGVVVVGAQLRQTGSVVIADARGVTVRWAWRGERTVPWSEILDVGVYRVRGTAMVLLYVDAGFEQRWLKDVGSGRAGALLSRLNISFFGAPTISLPTPLDADVDEFADWVGDRARYFRGEH